MAVRVDVVSFLVLWLVVWSFLPGPEIGFGDTGILPAGDRIWDALERDPG